MGVLKNNYTRGFKAPTDIYVCNVCIRDYALQQCIVESRSNATCSYCASLNSDDIVVGKMSEVIPHIYSSILSEWAEPSERLAFDQEDQRYIGNIYTTFELLQHIDLEVMSNDILEDISEAILNNAWCAFDPYSMPESQEILSTWEEFCEMVMTKTRYFFSESENNHPIHGPHTILEHLSEIITKLFRVTILEQNRDIFRVRIVDGNQNLTTALELGSPPREYATTPNRMSPAGISMFYGAVDFNTAIAETYIHSEKKQIAICGVFRPTRILKLIDFSKIEIPSLFDSQSRHLREKVKFFRDFIDDFTKPIDRSDKSHVDYVPTQIVTEYLRYKFRCIGDGRIDGLIYPSSKPDAKNAMVIFADSEQCADPAHTDIGKHLLTLNRVFKVELPYQAKN